MRAVPVIVAVLLSTLVAQAQPSGRAHPRLWLTDDVLAQLKARAMDPASQVRRAITRCDDAVANPTAMRNVDGGYQGLGFASLLGACAVAWKVTGNAGHGTAAVRYFQALLDDYQRIDDNMGGDGAVCTDSGYAMRAFAPYAAVAYDWLHDAPGVDDALRAHARARFAAWITAYPDCGYRAESPGTNYHAGYLWGATLIGIAEAGEAGTTGDAHWTLLTGTIWAQMAAALAPGKLLDGGDWLEGWQYGPLSVAEYALAARAMAENGAGVPAFASWPEMLLIRWRHALAPGGDRMFIGGDVENEEPNRDPPHLVLFAILGGFTTEEVRAHARAELARLPADRDDFYLFGALAEGIAGASTPFPGDAPTWYQAAGSRTLFARTSWSNDAVWLVAQCSPQRDVDHQPPNAGNFVLSRGADDLVVDPTPYGSLSSLTSNAPTAPSEVLPAGYSPSQAAWGDDRVGFAWARQTASGTAVARCDYAQQFAFREVPPDVAWASRDLVLWPTADGAALVVIDRLSTGEASRPLMLRFRTAGDLTLAGTIAKLTRGASGLSIATALTTTGAPSVRAMPVDDCFGAGTTRGGCDTARFAGDEVRLEVAAAEALAVHVIDATPGNATVSAAQLASADGVRTVRLERGGKTLVVAYTDRPSAPGGAPLSVEVPAGSRLVFLDAPRSEAGRTDASVTGVAGGCRITLSPGGALDGRPFVAELAADCTLAEDPAQPTTQPGPPPVFPDGGIVGSDGGPLPGEEGDSAGCACRTQGTGGSWLGAAGMLLVLAWLSRRRAP